MKTLSTGGIGKKSVIIGAAGLLLFMGIAIYGGMWIRAKKTARPLYGNFDVSMKCSGGHEIFLELDSATAYENCPGHRDRKLIGSVTRTATSAVVVDARDGSPWMQIEWDGKEHLLSFIKRPDSQSIMGMIPVRDRVDQVTSPWRILLPKYLPED